MSYKLRPSALRSRAYKQKIAEQDAEISRLRAAIRELSSDQYDVALDLDDSGSDNEKVEANSEEGVDIDLTQDTDSEGEADDDGGDAGIWDSEDLVYRCPSCFWEVVDGQCQSCCELLNYDEDREELQGANSLTTENLANSEDRRAGMSLILRPPRPLELKGLKIPAQYTADGREDKYRILLSCGATPTMCKTFNLEFSAEKGIIAWADWQLYADFASPVMRHGDFWKIALGRRVELEAGDLDGSRFIEDLLEDAVLFDAVPLQGGEVWKTVEESPGIWSTRLCDSSGRRDREGSHSSAGLPMEESDDGISSSDDEDYVDPGDARRAYELLRPIWDDYESDTASMLEEDVGPGMVDADISDADPGWGAVAQFSDGEWPARESDDLLWPPKVSDSEDSDFDEDETMSGDEDIMGQ